MKKTFATAALILATAASAATAQGMEGHKVGYSDTSNHGDFQVVRSAEDQEFSLARDTFTRGQFRAEDQENRVITVFSSLSKNVENDSWGR